MASNAQAVVAQAFRDVNGAYKPFYDAPGGDLALWNTLDVETVMEWVARSEIGLAAQNSWHRAGGRGCPFGQKGCPPWGFVSCLACCPEVKA